MRRIRAMVWQVALMVVAFMMLPLDGAVAAELTVYYGAVREQMEPVLKAFGDAHPDIAVKSFRAPTEELATTMDMELKAGKPRFDVVCAVYSPIWTLQQRYKAFRTLSPKDGERVLAGLRDPEQIQVPFGFGIYVIEYNTKLVSKVDAPKGWADLLDRKWTNKIVLADPRSSASVHSLIWYLTQQLASKGKPYGWAYFEELQKLSPRYVASHGTIGEMVNIGERPVGLQVMQVVETAVAKGEPIGWTFPQDGIPAETSNIAVRANSPNQKAAEEFVNFMVSKDGQMLISKHMGFSPVRDDVPFAYKDGTQVKDLKVIRRDDVWIANNRTDVIARFRDLIK
jgi:iron(III) transport system substrate-binding protein